MKSFIFLVTGIQICFCGVTWPGDFYFQEAGQYYRIAPELLSAIAKVESNYQINAINRANRNGTYDFCHMQINSTWKKQLKGNWNHLREPYYCTMVGAWILRQCIDRYGYNWNAVACYNTGSSPSDAPTKALRKIALRYVEKVQSALNTLQKRTVRHGEAAGTTTVEQ